jgi:uncharacterized protein (TIGR03437 family)
MSIRRILFSLAIVQMLLALAASARYTFVLPPPNSPNPQVLMFNDNLQRAGAVNVPQDTTRVFLSPAGNKAIILTRSVGSPVLFASIENGLLQNNARPLALDGNLPLRAELSPDGAQLIVLSDNSTGILYRIDITTESIPSGGRILSATGARDFSISYDSRYAFVISSNTLVIADLVENRIVQTVSPLDGSALSVTTSPRGSFYIGAQGFLVEYDAFPPFARKGSIPTQFGPGKLTFSPDGRYGLAPNALQNGASLLSFDLETRGITAPSGVTVNAVATPINGQLQIPDRIMVLNETRALAFYPGAKQVFEISIPHLAVSPLLIGGTPLQTCDGISVSEEYPAVRNIYYSVGGSLGRFDIQQNIVFPTAFSQAGTTDYGIVVTPGRAPSNVYALNGGQTVDPGALARPIFLRVTEGTGRPVQGARIVLTASVTGVTLNPESPSTNASGVGAFAVTAPVAPGVFTIRAQAMDGNVGPNTTVEITVRGTPGGGGGGGGGGTGGGLVKWSGDGQLIAQSLYSDPVVVRVTDDKGAPVVNKLVTFSGESGAFVASLDFNQLGVVQTVTDANGFAAAKWGGNPSPPPGPRDTRTVRVTAASDVGIVSFVGVVHGNPDGPFDSRPIIIPQPTQNTLITIKLGQKIDNAVRASIQARLTGEPIANVGMTVFTQFSDPNNGPTATCEGRNPLSGTDGFVNCNLIAAGRPGAATLYANIGSNLPLEGGTSNTSGVRVLYQLLVEAGDPQVIVKTGGDNQRGLPGTLLPVALQASIQDNFGNPLIGIPVTWEVVTPGSLTLNSPTTSSSGAGAVSARVLLGPSPGTYTVRLTAGTKSTEFTVNIDANIGAVSKVGGDNQVAITGQAFAQPLVVEVRDTQNRPVPNLRVTWAVASGAVGLSSTTSNTGPDGRALVNVVAGATAGAASVTAAVSGQNPVSFGLNVRLPGPLITSASFSNLASGEQVLTPGGLVVIRGQGLALGVIGTLSADLLKAQLPISLNDSTVQFTWNGGQSFAPIYSITNANGQESIVAQVPFEMLGATASATVVVKGGNTTVQNIPVRPFSPGILEDVIGGRRMAILIRPDGSRVAPDNPARRGETIRMYVIGLGQTSPQTFTNYVGFPGQKVRASLTVGIDFQGGVTLKDAFMAENLIGVYEVVFEIPLTARTGSEIPLTLSADDQTTGTRYFSNDSFIPIA